MEEAAEKARELGPSEAAGASPQQQVPARALCGEMEGATSTGRDKREAVKAVAEPQRRKPSVCS